LLKIVKYYKRIFIEMNDVQYIEQNESIKTLHYNTKIILI